MDWFTVGLLTCSLGIKKSVRKCNKVKFQGFLQDFAESFGTTKSYSDLVGYTRIESDALLRFLSLKAFEML
jgi:hypothetical protein